MADFILLIYILYDYNFSDNKGDYCVLLQMVSILLFSFYIVANNLLVKQWYKVRSFRTNNLSNKRKARLIHNLCKIKFTL